MALTFVNCRSCGGRTQISPRVPAEKQVCMLCGESCGGGVEDFEIPSAAPLAEKPAAHVPAELAAGTCPHCFADVVVDPARHLKAQRCHACGQKLVKRRRKNQEKKADAPGAEAFLFQRAKERVWLPIAGIALAVVMASIWAIWMLSRPETKNAEAPEVIPPSEDEAMSAVVEGFSAARTAEEMLPFIREPEKFAPAVRAWCAAHPERLPVGGSFIKMVSTREAPGHVISQVSVQLPRDAPVSLWMLVKSHDTWRVEWRAFTGIADIAVEEFAAKKPDAPALVLSLVQRSDYYNGTYASRDDWQSLRVTDRMGGVSFHAYVPRREAALLEKLKVLPPSRRDGVDLPNTARRLALRMRFASPEAAALGLAEVSAIEGDGWFIP